MKGLVIYESKYGNTKIVAEKIIEDITKVKKIKVDLKTPKEIKANEVGQYDFLLFGSPNHMGRATRGIRDFIEKVGKEKIEGKKVVLFDTYAGENQYEKAIRSMEEVIKNKTKGLSLVQPGLSIRVEGMKGPIIESELEKCKVFGKELTSRL